jgi:tetratricopeptide (TPR) repeat protein
MSPILHSGHDFADSEWLRPHTRNVGRRGVALLAILAAFCLCSPGARAQAAQAGVEAYAEAIRQSVIAQRITAMERYLALSSGGSLKVDALEFLVWDHMRLGRRAQSVQHARELLAIAPGNPVAIAVLEQAPPAGSGKHEEQKRLAALKSAASALERLARPEGMPDRNFDALRRQVATMLSGATGLAYLRSEDYPSARVALGQAVNNDPNNVQWVYGLGLALLSGKEKDDYHGYWYLARAANLSGSREIADYARQRYHSGGGKEGEWQAFVASAAALDAPPSPAGSVGENTATAMAANPGGSRAAAPDNTARSQAGRPRPPAAAGKSTLESASLTKRSKNKTSFGFEDTLREPPRTSASPGRTISGPKSVTAPSEAVSLGILIETSLLTSHNRAAIISTLKDIVRNLRSRDEACILVFSDQLDFEQDLTADDKLLEEALGQIRPKPGKALLSGISFAAGHLKRIGKNSNRILLIVTDGAGKAATADTLSFRTQVTGVRIDCIGLQAGDQDRTFLERIAAYSGGTASFASSPAEFRTAALTMTRNIGIVVP